jgi:formylglycine-generating enzyme required for sulfatase activity
MKTSANGYRLPTEAEWEYAARGGDQTDTTNWWYTYAGSNTVGDVAWYQVNSLDLGSSNADYGAHPVGTKAANSAGLYDMSGNVFEWCQDYYGSIGTGTEVDPVQSAGTTRVLRGGSWYVSRSDCGVTYRFYSYTVGGSISIGFRLVCRE